jgi:murein L,D-transpeptidase YafK
MMAVSIGMTYDFIKTISLKKERNWCLNHVNILSGSKVMTKNKHQNLYTFWTDLSKWPPNFEKELGH